MKKYACQSTQISQYVQEQIKKEPFYQLNEASIMIETQELQLFQKAKVKQIFMRIIYLYNQGTKFEKQDQEVLYFRITKLFESQNQVIRRIACSLLKALISHEFSYILISSIAKDIISENVQFKLNAIKLIQIINDEVSIVQIERLWLKSIGDENELISNAAIIAGINLCIKFPKIIQQWFPQILNHLKEEKMLRNYHALILLYKISRGSEIKKFNFNKFLHDCVKKDATPLFKIQLIKFIKEAIQCEREQQYKKEFTKFLFKELNNKNKMVAMEAAKALISIQLSTQDIQKQACFLKQSFESETNNINRNFILQLYLKIVNDSKKVKVLNEMQITFLQNQIYEKSICLSSVAIKICLTIYKLKNVSEYITQLYIGAQLTEKINILNGLNDLVLNNTRIGLQLDNFIQTQFPLISEYELLKAAIHFIQNYIWISSISEQISIKILLNYANFNIPKVKYAVIVLLRQVMKEQCPPMDDDEIEEEIIKLKFYYQKYFAKNQTLKSQSNQTQANSELKYQNLKIQSDEQDIKSNNSLQLNEQSHLLRTDEK